MHVSSIIFTPLKYLTTRTEYTHFTLLLIMTMYDVQQDITFLYPKPTHDDEELRKNARELILLSQNTTGLEK